MKNRTSCLILEKGPRTMLLKIENDTFRSCNTCDLSALKSLSIVLDEYIKKYGTGNYYFLMIEPPFWQARAYSTNFKNYHRFSDTEGIVVKFNGFDDIEIKKPENVPTHWAEEVAKCIDEKLLDKFNAVIFEDLSV